MATKKNAATARNQIIDLQHALPAAQRPDVGVQEQFNTGDGPKTYRYDSNIASTINRGENVIDEYGNELRRLLGVKA